MEVNFLNEDYRRLENDGAYASTFSPLIVSSYRKQLQVIRAALNEHDLNALKSLQFTKLNGKDNSQYSIRLNDQSCLIVELSKEHLTKAKRAIRIIRIEKYNYEEK